MKKNTTYPQPTPAKVQVTIRLSELESIRFNAALKHHRKHFANGHDETPEEWAKSGVLDMLAAVEEDAAARGHDRTINRYCDGIGLPKDHALRDISLTTWERVTAKGDELFIARRK